MLSVEVRRSIVSFHANVCVLITTVNLYAEQ